MVEEQVDVEYISLHRYIRNTPSDTEVHAEHHLRADRVPDRRKNIYIEPCKTRQDKGTRGENSSVSRTCPRTVEELKQGSNPHIWLLSEREEKHFRLRVKQLICGSVNGMRIRQSLLQPYIPWTGKQVPWKVQQLGAGVQGLWRNPRARAAVDCGEMD